MRKIGLFPLNMVLFPESVYPLHIFEERYKDLINECLKQGSEFGINLVTSSKMYDVGCSAKVLNVIKTYPDGKMDVNVIGEKRYNLISFTENDNSYYTGEVEYITDRDEMLDEPGLIEVVNLFNEVARTIRIVSIKDIDIDSLDVAFPSYLIAQKCGLTPLQKQELLEMKSENNRLSYLRRHLKNIIPALNEAQQIDRIVQNDGYLTPNQFNR